MTQTIRKLGKKGSHQTSTYLLKLENYKQIVHHTHIIQIDH